jgi:2,5-diamino-6-(ribosylamino)-4(3H)-pyrimidinone 5'-phosphate reductase
MEFKKSFEEIKKALSELMEENKKTPIVVEGDKDVFSLRKLGITGEIITTNSGLSIIDFCDKIANNYREIILLTDWDKKGGFICHTIERNLEGRVKCNLYYRELFATKAMTKTVEGLYSWFTSIEQKIDYDNKSFSDS